MRVGAYRKVITKDGSPTLEWQASDGRTETMHSPDGAWSETLYIYAHPLELLLEKNWPASILSMGLGVGYVEFMVAALLLKRKCDDQLLNLTSFEKDSQLVESLCDWLLGNTHEKDYIYDETLKLIADHYGLESSSLKMTLKSFYKQGLWQIKSQIEDHKQSPLKYNLLLYDAFSGHSQPELWSNHFLERFLQNFAAENCIFSTYAATGVLKRTLKSQNFQVLKKAGFALKRESTLAVREKLPQHP